MSPSGLARRAGLDATTFNKSKRLTPAGRARWPSTESLAKILAATGASLADFVELMGQHPHGAQATRLPVIPAGQCGGPALDITSPRPPAAPRSELQFPSIRDPNAFAVEIEGDDLLPVYRDGAVLVVSPNAPIRCGDRVVMWTAGEQTIFAEVKRYETDYMAFVPIGSATDPMTIRHDDAAWCGRIVWASQ